MSENGKVNQNVEQTIGKIRDLCQRSMAEEEFSYEHNEELGNLCSALSDDDNYDIWAPLLFELIEEFDDDVDLTLGSPGPLVHTLEEGRTKSREYLLASLARKPTGIAVWMASRISRSPGVDKVYWIQKIKDVLNHPNATSLAREMAEDE